MKRHWSYLKYVLTHKWWVFRAGLKTGAPLWRLIIHDWSKFLPSEWFPYARTFYGPDGEKRFEKDPGFDNAWNLHQKRNKHHWQYWCMPRDEIGTKCIPVPEKYIREMVADWMGAGRAIAGRWEIDEWYPKNYNNIQLESSSRSKVDELVARCALKFTK